MDLMTGRYEVHADFDIVLLPGRYSIGVGIHHPDGMTVDFVRRVFDFLVLKVAQNGNDHFPWSTVRGYVGGLARWQIRQTIPQTPRKKFIQCGNNEVIPKDRRGVEWRLPRRAANLQ